MISVPIWLAIVVVAASFACGAGAIVWLICRFQKKFPITRRQRDVFLCVRRDLDAALSASRRVGIDSLTERIGILRSVALERVVLGGEAGAVEFAQEIDAAYALVSRGMSRGMSKGTSMFDEGDGGDLSTSLVRAKFGAKTLALTFRYREDAPAA